MTDQTYDPPADQIAKLVATRTPEQLAIAYLRAVRRAKSAEKAFDIMASLSDAQSALHCHDEKGVVDALMAAKSAAETLPRRTDSQVPQ